MTIPAKLTATLAIAITLAIASAPSSAAMPVIDVRAITQMVSQLRTLQSQLTTARDQLTQARSAFTSTTGSRGMQNLLGNVTRNYLPADWQQLAAVMQDTSQAYGQLASDVQQLIHGNAVLSAAQLAQLQPTERALVEEGRRNTATLAALTRQALATSGSRFTQLQQLVSAIGTATDPKAIDDLQARVQAETAMLQNDAIKLSSLYESHAAEEALRHQRLREQALSDTGSLRALAPLGL
jgi:type IV secretion system protein VirB5